MQLKSNIARPGRTRGAIQEASESLHDALTDLVRVYQFRDRDKICCHDISVTQCYALEAVVREGQLRLNALAEQLLLDKSTSSRVVDALERKGYVERFADTADARAIALRATAAGKRLSAKIRAELVKEHEAVIADLTPEARRTAVAVITRLARAAERRFGCSPGVSCGKSACAPRAEGTEK